MPTVHVIAVVTAKPGMRDNLLKIFDANVPAVRAENGCIAYEATIVTVDAGAMQAKFGEDTFVVVEKWDGMDALQAHAAAPHMAVYSEKTKDLVADIAIHVLSAV